MNKKKLLYILPAVLAVGVIVAVVVALSGSSKMKNLLKQVPADAEIVAVGNVQTILESAGGKIEDSKISLPSFFTDFLGKEKMKDVDKANEFLKKSGIDPEACAVFGFFKKNNPVVLFALNDAKQFVKTIEEEGFKEKDKDGDITIYTKKVYEGYEPEYDDYGYIAINGNYAYWIERVWAGSDLRPTSFLPQVIKDAADKNFADTPYGSYILEGNAGGVAFKWPKEMRQMMRENGVPSDLLSIYDGTVCLRGNLKKEKAEVVMKMFDENGKELDADLFKDFMDPSAQIDKKALKLLGKDEVMVMAASLKEVKWDKYADLITGTARMSRAEKAQINVVFDYLKNVEGTVAAGFGLTNGMESVKQMNSHDEVMRAFSATLVVETKDGKAKRIMDDLKGLMEKMRMPFEDQAKGFTIDLSQMGTSGKVYAGIVDDFIVVANHPIKEEGQNIWANEGDLTDYISAFGLWLKKDNKLMRDLGLPYEVKFTVCCKPKSMETSMVLEIDGDDSPGVIAGIAKLALKMAEKGKEMSGQRYAGNKLSEENRDDEAAADSVYIDDTDAADSAAL